LKIKNYIITPPWTKISCKEAFQKYAGVNKDIKSMKNTLGLTDWQEQEKRLKNDIEERKRRNTKNCRHCVRS